MPSNESDKPDVNADLDEIETRMRDRMQTLLRDYSHSEIARRTGVRHQYVQRYLAGTRVPASFCSVLIGKMGVNAQWLMMGEGAARAADVSAEALAKTGGLLELVNAMNAVARMRLGELFGKDHLKVLRELGDALDRFESIKRSLGAQSRQTYEQVLNNLNEAITDKKHDLARNLINVAEQVSRLCDDEKMNARLDTLRSRIEMNAGNPDEALRYGRRSFLRLMFDNEQANTPEFFGHGFNFLLRLGMTCRYREGRNRCQALLEMGEEMPAFASVRDMMLCMSAHFDNDLGYPRRASDTMLDVYPAMQDESLRQQFTSAFVRSMLLSGRCDFPSAFGIGADHTFKAVELMRFAAWLEDPDALKLVTRRFLEKPDQPYFSEAPDNANHALIIVQIRTMLAMIERGDASLLGEWIALNDKDRADPDNNVSGHVSAPIRRTQMLRLAGRLDEAKEWLLTSAAELDAIGPEFTTNIVTRATHHRNALELIPKDSRAQRDRELRTAAQSFFDESFAKGYGCFRKWASRARHA